MLVSSHLLSEMQALADDVVIIAAGKLLRQGPVVEVLGGDARVHARTPEPEKLGAALRLLGAGVTADGPNRLRVTGMAAEAVGDAALAAGVALHQLATDQPDLEDVFLDLTQAKAAIR